MEIAIARIAKILIAALMMLALGVQSAIANNQSVDPDQNVVIKTIKNPDLVTIQPSVIDGLNVDIVKVGNLPEFAVRAALDTNDFTDSEKEKLSVIRRDILDKTITGLIVGTSDLPILISDDAVVKTSVTKTIQPANGERVNFFEHVQQGIAVTKVEGESANAAKKRKTLREKAATAIAFLNENILRSTYQAGSAFVRDSKGTKGFREFGLSVVFRGEFQIGVGKTNVMRTIARGLDIGYDIKSKELVIRTVIRHEKMDGGTAMALGPKMELRAYRANLDEQEHKSADGHMHGKTWYPPAPPLLTFASESYPGYHSLGTALALNVFDVVVPTYLFNTVNEFDADYHVTRVPVSPVKLVKLTVASVKRWLLSRTHSGSVFLAMSDLAAAQKASASGPMAQQCRAIFSRAN